MRIKVAVPEKCGRCRNPYFTKRAGHPGKMRGFAWKNAGFGKMKPALYKGIQKPAKI